MKKNLKKDNKGFSLVELIVVIAIMGILAVTLAPRLTQYIEKARKASDQEVVNTIFTAAKLANVEYPLEINKTIILGAEEGATIPLIYSVADNGKDWTLNSTYTVATTEQEFINTFMEMIGNFSLKSKNVKDASTGIVTQITLDTDAEGKLSVTLDYDGDTASVIDPYTVSE